MGWFTWGKKRSVSREEFLEKRERGSESNFERARINVGEITPENSRRWRGATDESVNATLMSRLETIRGRCEQEYYNNTFIEGIVGTHIADIIGPSGPSLQIESSNKNYNERAEDVWAYFCEHPEINDELKMPEVLAIWLIGQWLAGGSLAIETETKDINALISYRIQNIPIRRVQTPLNSMSDEYVIMGIRVSKTGKRLQYGIVREDPTAGHMASSLDADWIDASSVIHLFRAKEPEQVHGIPWLTPGLEIACDIRDYDKQVLRAATKMADTWATMESVNTNLDPVELDAEDTIEIHRDAIIAAPPGWSVRFPNPSQPAAQYTEFRRERHLDLGRAINMPAMLVRLDSSLHNYSSARFDDQVYARGILCIQSWLERYALNRMLNKVLREAELRGILPVRPKDFRAVWTWPKRPNIDAEKEAEANKTELGTAATTLVDVLHAKGINPEEHAYKLKKSDEILALAGLPPMRELIASMDKRDRTKEEKTASKEKSNV
jgi:capsid protein